MSHVIALVNTFAAAWADALVRACWQGGLVIALVWTICRLWPALPPGPRCWLWRLAYAKLLLGLVWLPPLALPLLPRPAAPPPPAQASVIQEQTAPSSAAADTLPPEPMAAAPPPSVPLPAPPAVAAPRPLPVRPTLPTLQTLLLTTWLLGTLASLARVASAWRRALALSRASTPIADDALHADAAELCRRLGLRRVPPLRVADGIPSPLLLGLGKPAVLLPAFVLAGTPRAEVKLMLAHELAHLARRDLLWDALPQTAHRLFFFHPLVWLAAHEWALAQEIACDALAVQAAGAPPSAYGQMLLGIATRRRDPAAPLFPTLAVAAPRHTLRRRLFAMQHIGTISRPRLILAAALTTALAVAGLLPWRVVAQSGTPLPAAIKARMARQEKERADFAVWEAQTDAQFAAASRRLPPARQKEAQARIAPMGDYIVKSQKHIRMMEQHRADYMAAHPYELSNAQAAEINRLLDLNIRRNGLNQSVTMGRILRVKLLADLTAAQDTPSQRSYRAQIERGDARRRRAEQEMRLLEPRIARQKAIVALIPEDQRALMDKLRHYDINVWGGRIEALTIKRSRLSVLQELLAAKPIAGRRTRQTTTKEAPAPPQARTASFEAVAIGGPPPLRLAQSGAPPSTTPAAVTHSEAVWQEQEQKQQADLASKNTKLDAQLAEVQKHLPPARLKTVQPWIASINAEYMKGQQRVQVWEQRRTDYLATHPNRLSDAQTAFVQKVNWDKMHPSRISEGIRWEQTIKQKLQAHVASSRDARSRQGWQRQIAAIDQRRREGEGQIRELGPVIARQDAELASIPQDQRDRVAKLRSYDLEISCGVMDAFVEKQVSVWYLCQRAAGKLEAPAQPSHASVEPQRPRTFQVSVQVPRQGTHRVRVLTRDTTGRHLILDKLCQAGESLSVPATAHGNKVGFLVYQDGKLVKDQSL